MLTVGRVFSQSRIQPVDVRKRIAVAAILIIPCRAVRWVVDSSRNCIAVWSDVARSCQPLFRPLPSFPGRFVFVPVDNTTASEGAAPYLA